MAHPPRQFHAKVAVQRRPGRVGGRGHAEAALVQRAQRRAVRGQVNARAQVGATQAHGQQGRLRAEGAPEAQHALMAGGRGAREEGLAVKAGARGGPRLGAAAKAIAEPQKVKAHVRREARGLAPQEGAQGRALGDAVREARVGARVAAQHRAAAHEAVLAQRDGAVADLGVPLVLEAGLCKLGPGVKGGAHGDARAGRRGGAQRAQARRQARQLCVSPGGRRWREQVAAGVRVQTQRVVGHRPRGVCVANVARPLKGRTQVPRVVQQLGAIGRPQQEGERACAPVQGRVLSQKCGDGAIKVVRGEGLEGQLQGELAALHGCSCSRLVFFNPEPPAIPPRT